MAGPFDQYIKDFVAPLEPLLPPEPPTPRELVGRGIREMNQNFKPGLAELVKGKSVLTPDQLMSLQRIKQALKLAR